MKRILSLLLVAALVFVLSACGKDNAPENTDANTTTTQTKIDGTTTICGENTTTKTPTTTSKATTTTTTKITTTTQPITQPVGLNPKTDFKFGKYVSKNVSPDKQTYTVCSLEFYQDFNGLEYQKIEYYTKEKCKENYKDWGLDFESEFYESKITVNGVTYYNVIGAQILPESYELTDTRIKLSPEGEVCGVLSLDMAGNLIVRESKNDRYGPVLSVFTPS